MLHLRLESIGLAGLLETTGMSTPAAAGFERIIVIALILAGSWIANFITRRFIVRTIHRLALNSKVTWDNRVVERRVLVHLSRIVPGLIIYFTAPLVAPEIPWIFLAIRRGTMIWITLMLAFAAASSLNVVNDIYQENVEIARRRPIKGVLQLVKVLVFTVTGVLAITTLMAQSPIGILSGFGAMIAVLVLVFRDSILGVVSGIQLSANDMVQIGDWIEMPKYEADGTVVDITLQTIKVQNWDKTFTTIPIYALVSDSFRNWRGMTESGGRRIKRAISIDMRSVKFMGEEMFERFRRFSRIRDYLDERREAIGRYNAEHNITSPTRSAGGERPISAPFARILPPT